MVRQENFEIGVVQIERDMALIGLDKEASAQYPD